MKRFLISLLVFAVVAVSLPAMAKEYTLSIDGPSGKSGTSFFVVWPAAQGKSGVTLIDRPQEKGSTWTLQPIVSEVSPYTKGHTGTTDWGGVNYQITLYFSNSQTGGSPYALPTMPLTGNTPYVYTIPIPACNYMWGTVTWGGTSAFYTLPLKLVTPEPW